MASHTEIFSDYFRRQFWGNKTGSSGPNSDPELTPLLRQNLQELLEKLKIKSLLDAGCGDANLFKAMLEHEPFKHRPLEYWGYECVSDLTSLNRAFFGAESFKNSGFNAVFDTRDIVFEPLPQVDLILSRDVLHYLPNPLIQHFLDNCLRSGSKYLLVTHNIHSEFSANSETEVGVFRPVNLMQKPFHYPHPELSIAEDVFAKHLALFDLERIRER